MADRPADASSDAHRSLKEVGGFELIAKIGQGGMGSVFKARQKSLDRIVALKILPPSIAKDSKFIERFQREARASAKLNHPNIVQGIDVGKDEKTGLWYFAMELVEGPSLLKLLKEQRVIPEERALKIALDMAKALESAAHQGIVHRDIKPDNILMTKTGEAKLADLGLAKQVTDDASVTQSGQAVGTPFYMAPEQVRGQADQIDQRTDIYALGGTLFHLVTGQPPFNGPTSPVIMTKHLTEPPPKANKVNPEVSEAMARLITRMMQKKKEQRVQNAKELIGALEKIIDGEDMPTPARSLRDTTGPRVPVSVRSAPAKENKSPVLMYAGAGIAALVVLALVFMKGKPEEKESRVANNEPPRNERPQPSPTPAVNLSTPKPPPVTIKKTEKKPPKEVPESSIEKIIPKADPSVAESDPVNAKTNKPDPDAPAKTDPDKTEKTEKPDKTEANVPDKTEKPDKTDKKEKPANPENEPAAIAVGPKRDWKGFKAEYYEGPEFETAKNEQVDPVIDFNWRGGAPPGMTARPGVSIRWSGFIEPPESGDYTFDVAAQAGARLYVDDMCIYDSWGGRQPQTKSMPVTLEKGKKYSLQLEMHQKSTENPAAASLKWSGPGMAATLVNADTPDTEAQGVPVGHLKTGWKAEYGKFDDDKAIVTRSEPVINWNWGAGSPAAGIPADKFWARWSGLISPPETDEYVFTLEADDGARLHIADMCLVDIFFNGGQKASSLPLKLEKGKRYLMKVDFYDRQEYASCSLKWSSKTMKETPVRAMPSGEPDGVLPPDGFLAEYGNMDKNNKGVLALTRRELTPGGNWRSGSPAPEINYDKFWCHYTGWITPPADGEYTLSVDYDEGVSVWLDDIMLFDSGYRGGDDKFDLPPINLKGGKHYFIRFDYREWQEYARFHVHWKSAAMTKRPLTGMIPEAFKPDSKDIGHLDTGVLAEYGGTGKTPLVKRLEGRMVHDFHSGSPSPEVPAGSYWGHWTGGLRVPVTGSYALKIEAEATADVKLNTVSVVKVPTPLPKGVTARDANAPKTNVAESQPLNLNKGTTYFLDINFTNKRGDYSYIKMYWKPPGKTDFEEIPPDVFLLPPQAREQARRPK